MGTIKLQKVHYAAPAVGQLYRQPGNGRLLRVVAVQGAQVTVTSAGHHLHGRVLPVVQPRTWAAQWLHGNLYTAKLGSSNPPYRPVQFVQVAV